MAVSLVEVRKKYVAGLQNAAQKVLELNRLLDELDTLYVGAGLSGTFQDAELEADVTTKHLAQGDIGTYTANLDTVNTAMSTAILRNLAKAVGKPI
jgi:hypothetical protein